MIVYLWLFKNTHDYGLKYLVPIKVVFKEEVSAEKQKEEKKQTTK